jgi:hypothetical protein
MIGWLGLCAKVVEFVVSKATGHAINLSLDQKRRAARAFVRFYEMLEDSSLLLEELLKVFDEAVEKKKPIFFSKDFVRFENRITGLTEDFVRQYDKLIDAIYIFDSRLARLLQSVEHFKFTSWTTFGLLLRKARFAIEFDGLHPFKKVSFSTFRDEVANINLEDIIKAQQFTAGQLAAAGGRLRAIPVGKHKYALVSQKPNKLVEALSVLLVEDEFTASDFEKVRYLRDRLKNQAKLLEQALPMLREFIASNFTISDVLGYRSDKRRAGSDLNI